MVTRAGETFSERKACFSLRRWSPRENMFIPGKFRRGWLVLKGLPFHLWEEDQLKFILKKWGRVTEIARETVKLLDLTKVKLWVEMHPSVVLPAVARGGRRGLETYCSSFSHRRRGRRRQCHVRVIPLRELLPRARYRRSSTSMVAKRENGWEGRRSGLVEEVILRPTGPESSTKAHPVRAQKGRRSRGLHAGPDVPQAHDAAASLSSPQRAGSPAKRPRSLVQARRGRRRSKSWRGWPVGVGQVQGGSKSSGLRYGSRERESAARKGKAPMDQMEDFTQGEKTTDSREMWSKLFLPSADRRHGQRKKKSSSEILPLRSAASLCEGRNLEVGWRDGSQLRESPIFRCLLPRKCNSWSKEETSTSRGVMESRKSQLKEDKGGFTGRAGYDPGSSSVTVSPSIPRTRGKEIILGGNCEVPGVETWNPHLPYSEILSQSPSEENQRAVFNQMSERSTPKKSSNLMPGSPGVNEASPPEDFLIDGLFLEKWLKCERSYALWTLRLEKPDVVMIQETKKEKCDRRLVGSVWTVRSKDWVILPACGASGGILFIWDSKKLCKEEVVLGSFSISVKFALEGCGPLWISAIYGPNSPSLRKDFWVELYDIYGLTFPLWCVGGDFNVIRRSSEKLGGSRLTSSMRDFDSFISESELLDPPLRNASFTWSNMQESPVCKRLDRFLYSNEWGQLFPQGIQETLIRRTSDHWPIALDTNPFMWGPTPFRFENMWLQHPSFKENFRNWWRGFQGNGWEGHKRNRKYIKSLENERGLVLNNVVSITEEILLYFEKLYANPKESLGVLKMDRDKAPGPDGFTIAVFQDCWDVIKEDLVRVFAEFHRSGVINQSTNASFIVLLPKKSTTKKISDFRPISLITSLYKIIAKVLSGRLRGVLHETIHSTQGAFVQGRQIMDAVLIANEIVDERRRSGRKVSSLKLILKRLTITGEKYVGGFRVGRNRTRVSHLQFADDTIFFSNTREEDLQTLKSLLLAFGHISGLKVNLDKSNIYGINLDQAHISRLAETLECKASGWPILYLGLPLAGTPGQEMGKEFVLGRFVVGDQPLGSQYPSLFRVVLDKNIPISSVLGPTRPFSWNLNFRRNLSDSEIEDLEGLMRSLDGVHLSPSVPDARLWPLSSSGLFSVKSFFLALSQFFGSPQVFPSKFVWNSQIPFKVQSFIWLVAHKKVNTNDMLQVRRPYKALSPDICILCMKHGESADHIFLHCSLTIGLWHRLFQLAKMDWVPPRSILDMMYIKFNGFGSSKRGIALWQAANIALIRIVWRERNARIFEDKARNSESLWDSIVFLASLWAYCSKVFKGTPLNAILLDWIAVCTP
ncbi:Transposon TX1 uncharacterized 149 kDa protein [Vitis vinifera]|uniref:Transposon TX1 uncharacterized 149 kDa protein n=1 Tax=Vitis vinifera TaxID=29760 RepID=A0A438IT16_VITVI|nr:Transposon TX1 uncharacterized 149 kDa protein [Vitis vinifera]